MATRSSSFIHGYALLIGVGSHATHDKLSLPVTVKDAEGLAGTLMKPELCGYPDDGEHVRLLTNSQATNSGILAGLSWLKAKGRADPEATIVIYFSGHGWVSPTAQYFLITQDTTVGAVSDTSLRATVFTAMLRDIAARRVLIVLDCCHAEGMAQVKSFDEIEPDFSQGLTASKNALASIVNALAQGSGRAVFSSCQGGESSYFFRDGSMSVFTYHFIEALQGAGHRAGETQVTLANLMAHVSKTVPQTSLKLYKGEQHPFYKIEATDFPIALIRGGKGLPAGGWSAVEPPARRYLERIRQAAAATGGSAVAHGAGAIAVAQRGVHVSGDVMGDVTTGTRISGEHPHGTRARRDKDRTRVSSRKSPKPRQRPSK